MTLAAAQQPLHCSLADMAATITVADAKNSFHGRMTAEKHRKVSQWWNLWLYTLWKHLYFRNMRYIFGEFRRNTFNEFSWTSCYFKHVAKIRWLQFYLIWTERKTLCRVSMSTLGNCFPFVSSSMCLCFCFCLFFRCEAQNCDIFNCVSFWETPKTDCLPLMVRPWTMPGLKWMHNLHCICEAVRNWQSNRP